MRFGNQIGIFLLVAALVVGASAQGRSVSESPVTRGEVRQWLTATEDDPEQSEQANRELIEEIERRGVNFVLSHEEEWAFGLLEATDELLVAIRDAVPAAQREALLRAAAQQRLYAAFMSNYTRTDLLSRRTALDAGKESIARFQNDPAVKTNFTFISRQLPNLERIVLMLERRPPVVVTRRN